MSIDVKPKQITKENFSKYGDLISTVNVKPTNINDGFAQRYDDLAKLDTIKLI